MKRGASYLAGAAALALGAWPLYLGAQIAEEDGGARLVADLDLRLQVDDGETTFRTGFDVDLISATRTQRLTFSTDVGLELDLQDFDTRWTDPLYELSYLRDTGRSRISAVAGYRSRDVDGELPGLDFAFDETDIIDDPGTETVTSLNLGVEWGLTDPIGGSLSYDYRDVAYLDTLDPSLFDRTTTQLGGTLRFDPSQTLSFTLDASLLDEDQDGADQLQRETLRYGISTAWQARPDVLVNARLGASEIDTTQLVLGTPISTSSQGMDASLGISVDRPNGNYGIEWDRSLTTQGQRTNLAFSRAGDLTELISYAASIGVTELPNGGQHVTGSFNYSQETRNGDIDVGFIRSANVTGLDNEVVRSQLTARYSGALPREATWSISGSYLDSDFTDPAEDDVIARQLSLSYRLPLTQDWSLATGATWRETETAGSATTSRNTLFVTMERRFSFRR